MFGSGVKVQGGIGRWPFLFFFGRTMFIFAGRSRNKKLEADEIRVVLALARGWTLKAHRFLDGQKVYILHALSGEQQSLQANVVKCLYRRGLIDSNKKFPAATFLLTEKGRHLARRLDSGESPDHEKRLTRG
jgi:hypothetical protein